MPRRSSNWKSARLQLRTPTRQFEDVKRAYADSMRKENWEQFAEKRYKAVSWLQGPLAGAGSEQTVREDFATLAATLGDKQPQHEADNGPNLCSEDPGDAVSQRWKATATGNESAKRSATALPPPLEKCDSGT